VNKIGIIFIIQAAVKIFSKTFLSESASKPLKGNLVDFTLTVKIQNIDSYFLFINLGHNNTIKSGY